MPLKPSLLSLLAACALLPATAAFAADYEPPVFVDEAPEYTPVEIGSGWYLRGDIGYHFEGGYGDGEYTNYELGLTPVEYSEKQNEFSGSIGIGYHFTDWLRTDVNLGIFAGNEAEASYDDGTVSADAEFKNTAWYGMANLYADLGTVAGFTPYVGGGIGVLRTKWEADGSYEDEFGVSEARYNERQYTMAYTLNAGVAYDLGGNVALDVGYQYFSAPDAEHVSLRDYDSYPVEQGLDFHQIRAGLRYDLW